MGIISVLFFFLFGGLWSFGESAPEEVVALDPIAEEFYSVRDENTGYCFEDPKPARTWKCVDETLQTSEIVIVDLWGDYEVDAPFDVTHLVIRADGSVTLFTEILNGDDLSAPAEWTRTECTPLATPRETVEACS